MIDQDICDPKKVVDHLHRIGGQIEALERMYEQKRDCGEIVQQIAAARSSLGSLAKQLLADEMHGCLPLSEKSDSIKKLLSKLVENW